MFCNHHHYLTPEHFPSPQKETLPHISLWQSFPTPYFSRPLGKSGQALWFSWPFPQGFKMAAVAPIIIFTLQSGRERVQGKTPGWVSPCQRAFLKASINDLADTVLPTSVCGTRAVILQFWSPYNLPDFSYHSTPKDSAVKIISKYCIQNQRVELPLDFTTHFCRRKLLLSHDSSFFEEEYPLVWHPWPLSTLYNLFLTPPETSSDLSNVRKSVRRNVHTQVIPLLSSPRSELPAEITPFALPTREACLCLGGCV